MSLCAHIIERDVCKVRRDLRDVRWTQHGAAGYFGFSLGNKRSNILVPINLTSHPAVFVLETTESEVVEFVLLTLTKEHPPAAKVPRRG